MSAPSTSFAGKLLSGNRELSQAQLYENAARAATGLVELGLGPENAVAMMLRNDFAFYEAAIAASSVGAQAVPVNWHFQAEEAGHILRDSRAKVLVAHADLLSQIRAGIPDGVRIFIVPTPPEIQCAYGISQEECTADANLPDWNEWISLHKPRESTGPSVPATSMIYTSGTTGKPKGVRRQPFTPESAAKWSEMVTLIFGFAPTGDFRTVVTGPMYHAAPNAYGLAAIRHGGRCILQPRFDPEELLQIVERDQITHLHMVPTMFVRLLKLSDETKRKYDLSSLRFVVHAAAPCAREVKRQMIEWWGPVINEYYGGTETGGVVFHTSEEALRKPGTVGRPLPGATIRIYGEQGNALGANQPGEVFARLEGIPEFTYNGQHEKRRSIERDGLVSIGDIGYLDEDGYLFLCDRKIDMVISGGVNIYPAEIEATLITMAGLHDCAVFGIPDEVFGEALCAYVEPQPEANLDAEQVRRFLACRLAHYKVPKTIEFHRNLPREDSGKIFKRKLRAPYWERAGRQI
jgi:long-chain acyl-CoA synthetase